MSNSSHQELKRGEFLYWTTSTTHEVLDDIMGKVLEEHGINDNCRVWHNESPLRETAGQYDHQYHLAFYASSSPPLAIAYRLTRVDPALSDNPSDPRVRSEAGVRVRISIVSPDGALVKNLESDLQKSVKNLGK